MGRRGEERPASLKTRQHSGRGMHVEKAGTGAPMQLYLPASVSPSCKEGWGRPSKDSPKRS